MLLIPVLVGLILIPPMLYKAAPVEGAETNLVAHTVQAWSQILDAVPGALNGYQEDSSANPAAPLNPTAEEFAVNNAFMISSALLMLFLLLGLSLLEASISNLDQWWMPLVRNTALMGIALLYYFGIGFNINYPGEFVGGGVFPAVPGIGLVDFEGGNSIDYGSGGYTYYTDALYQALYCAMVAWLVMTVSSGIVGRIYGFLLATASSIIYPFISSWKWGGGWLDEMGAYDFAGGALVHVVAGSIALVGIFAGGLGGIAGLRLLGTARQKHLPGNQLTPWGMPLAIAGLICLFPGILGVTMGSVLSADPDYCSVVFVNTLTACLLGGLTACGFAAVHSHSFLLYGTAGVIAGWAAISGPTDSVAAAVAGGLGIFAGLLAGLTLIILGYLRLTDSLGIVGGCLAGGAIGTLLTGLLTDISSGIVAQATMLAACSLTSILWVIPVTVMMLIAALILRSASRKNVPLVASPATTASS